MAEILDVLHRFSYEVTGQEKVTAIEKQFQRNAEIIAKNVASLARLQNALNNTTDPAQQARLTQAINNRTQAIEQQNAAMRQTILTDTNLQSSLQREIGVLNELANRLNLLREARQRATSTTEIQQYNQQIAAIEARQRQLTAAPAARLSITRATPTANSNVLASPATAQSVNAVRSLQGEIGIINQLNKKLEELRAARQRAMSTQEIQNYNRQIQAIEEQQRRLTTPQGSRLGGLGAAISQGFGVGLGLGGINMLGNAVGFIKNFATESFKAAANFDQLRVAFQSLIGNAPKADRLIEQIQQFAKETPFGVEQLAQLSKQLIAFGFNSEEIIPTLNEVGNIAAGVGRDRLPQIVLALGQIRSAGKLTGQDLLQLVNAGFNPLQETSERTGVAYGKLKEEMEKGRFTFAMVKESFKAATSEGGKFYNLMQRQTNTVAGQIDRLGDSVQQLKVGLGALFQDAGADFIKFLGDAVEGINEWVKADPASEIRKEQLELNTLVNTVIQLNENNTARNQLIAQIRQQYPDFLGKLSDEQITTGFLASRLADVNAQYQQRIKLIGLAQVREGILEKRRQNASAQVNAATIRGALSASGIDKEISQVTANDLDRLSKEDRTNLERTLRSAGLINSLTRSTFFNYNSAVLSALNEADELERRAINTNKGIDKAYMDAEKRENEATDAAKRANETQQQRYKDELAGAKVAEETLKQIVQSGKATASQLAEYDTVSARIADLNNLIATKDLEMNPVAPTTPAAYQKESKERTKKGKDPYTLAKEALDAADEQRRLDDEELKNIRDVRDRQNEMLRELAANEKTSQATLERVQAENAIREKQLALLEKRRKNSLDTRKVLDEIRLAEQFNRPNDLPALRLELRQLTGEEIQIEADIVVNAASIRMKPLDSEQGRDLTQRVQEAIQKSLNEGVAQSGRSRAEFNQPAKENMNIFGGDMQRDIKESIELYDVLTNTAVNAYNSIADAKQQQIARELEYQQYAISQAQILAERGNTEVLKQEEERQRELIKRQREAARQQQIINQALVLSNALVAVARAAAEGGGYGSIATVAATIAALGAGYAFVQSFSRDSAQGFKDGVIDLKGAGSTKSDSIPARLSRGESVMTAEATAMYKPILEKMQALEYNPFQVIYPKQPETAQGYGMASSKEVGKLNKKLDGVIGAIRDYMPVKVNTRIDQNGVANLVERSVKNQRQRWS